MFHNQVILRQNKQAQPPSEMILPLFDSKTLSEDSFIDCLSARYTSVDSFRNPRPDFEEKKTHFHSLYQDVFASGLFKAFLDSTSQGKYHWAELIIWKSQKSLECFKLFEPPNIQTKWDKQKIVPPLFNVFFNWYGFLWPPHKILGCVYGPSIKHFFHKGPPFG